MAAETESKFGTLNCQEAHKDDRWNLKKMSMRLNLTDYITDTGSPNL